MRGGHSYSAEWDHGPALCRWVGVHWNAGKDWGCFSFYRFGGAGRFSGWVGSAAFQGGLAVGKAIGFAGGRCEFWGSAGDDPVSVVAVEFCRPGGRVGVSG